MVQDQKVYIPWSTDLSVKLERPKLYICLNLETSVALCSQD